MSIGTCGDPNQRDKGGKYTHKSQFSEVEILISSLTDGYLNFIQLFINEHSVWNINAGNRRRMVMECPIFDLEITF